MRTLETVGLTIALLIAAGRFLDSEHIESSTKDRIRSSLIALYLWLYSIPAHFKLAALKAKLDGFFESPELDATTGRTVVHRKSIWAARFYYLVGVPSFALGFAYFAQFVLRSDADGVLQQTKEQAWWIGLFGGLTLSVLGALMLSMVTGMLVIVSMLIGLVALGVLDSFDD